MMERCLRDRLRLHLDTHEVLILSGGVSMGQFDLVPRALEALGVQRVLHGIAQRPGKPMWFGTTGEGRAVFALPGNPVSTLVCLARYVVPALYAAMGVPGVPAERVALGAPVPWKRRSPASCRCDCRGTTGPGPGPNPARPMARGTSPRWR